MKYSAEAYMKAFTEALNEHPSKKDHIVKSFLQTLSRNGDWASVGKVFNLITKKITHDSDGLVVSAEFARPLSEKMISEFKKKLINCYRKNERNNRRIKAGHCRL